MKKALVILGVFATAPLLSGCLIADVAGAAVGITSAVVGGAVDLVTTSEDEQQSKDIEKLKKENEELRRQQAGQKQ
jgi:hypothetical protein